MQYPQHNSDSSHRSSVPPGSPWRGSQMPLDNSVRGPSAQSNFGQGPGLKLPSLPRLGSSNQHSQAANQRQPHQPSFAQMVQAHQPNPAGHSMAPAGKTPDSRIKYSNAGSAPRSSTPGQGGPNGNGYAQRDTGAQILGSVNAHMMPKVNTSYGMSSLNTVLPGMSSDGSGAGPGPSKPTNTSSSTVGGPVKQKPSNENLQNSTLMQNLSLQDRHPSSVGTASASAAGAPGQQKQDTERYGLKSLLDVMESKNKEKQNVMLGSDMSQSGLDLSSTGERLSHTFASPWQETSKHPVIPDFKLPACYNIDTVVPQQQKLQSFDEGALFYIFYTMPRDAMQEAAAVELTNRSWRYHKELKMWLTKDPLSEPIQTNNQEESGIYIFFDPTSWKKIKREYILYYPDIA